MAVTYTAGILLAYSESCCLHSIAATHITLPSVSDHKRLKKTCFTYSSF